MARRIHYSTTDGVQRAVAYWSLREEVQEDASAFFRQTVIDAFDVDPQTMGNIDDFRAHFNPKRSLDAFLRRKGHSQAVIDAVPPVQRDVAEWYANVALLAIIYDHGRIAGGSSPLNWDEQEMIP
ncbi:MAG TPA: hypothetical protein VGC20_02335 [bacterium]